VATLPLGPSIVRAFRLSETFREYIPAAWAAYSPKPFIPNWHIDAIADHLQAISLRQINRLVISIPPRHAKSSLTAVLWPTWEWTSRPSTRFVYGSYKLHLAVRDALWSRRLILSKFYQQLWRAIFQLSGDQNVKSLYENDQGGRRLCASVEAGTTGEGGDILVMDDPLDIRQAGSPTYREGARDYWDQVWSNRMDPPTDGKAGAMVLIAQRTHEEDVTGHVLKEEGWEHLCIPEEYEAKPQVEVTGLGWRDPRQEEAELLWPAGLSAESAAKLKKKGAYAWATLYQQRPAPVEGGIIKRTWWRFWTPRCTCHPGPQEPHSRWCPANLPIVVNFGHRYIQEEIPEEMDEWLQSWDMNFKGDIEGSDPGRSRVSGGVWSRSGPQMYLVHRVNDDWGLTETENAVVEVSADWPLARKKLVEYKANGPAIIAKLRRKVGGFVPVTPTRSKVSRVVTAAPTEGDKYTRALSMEGTVQAGDIYLPHPAIAPWVWAYIEEHALFPNGPHDDDVDMTSQAVAAMAEKAGIEAEKAHHDATRPEATPPKTTQEIFHSMVEKALQQEDHSGRLTPKRRRALLLRSRVVR
jgi:predicted phage terminase large subunit-like protein